MELLTNKCQTLATAVESFRALLAVDLTYYTAPIILDGIKNGQIQKFEYTAELSWKLIKKFLWQVDGIETKSPKSAIKAFYTSGHVDEAGYRQLIEMIDDRNFLSHIYDEGDFVRIHQKLSSYCT